MPNASAPSPSTSARREKVCFRFCREPYECSRLWLTWKPFHWLDEVCFVCGHNFMTKAEILINCFYHRIGNILMYYCRASLATYTWSALNYYIFRNTPGGSTSNPKITTLVKPTSYPSLSNINHGVTTIGKPRLTTPQFPQSPNHDV